MKFKKILLFLITILFGCGGLLFGCTIKPLKLVTIYGEDEIEKITLNLPTSSNKNSEEDSKINDEQTIENQEQSELTNDLINEGEDEKEEILPLDSLLDSVTIIIKAENENNIFKKGLNINVSEKNIVKISLIKKGEGYYLYKITALIPKNVVISFETKDKKTKTNLAVEVLQDCDKIENNIQSKNYIIYGENKEISNTVLKYTPNTTTNKDIEYSLAEAYEGIIIENGIIKFTGEDVNVNQIMVNAKHKKYDEVEAEEQNNFIVENIIFDILSPIDEIVALKNDAVVNNLEFASNMSLDSLNYSEIKIKKKINEEYLDIGNTYYLEYYLENNDELINIDDARIDNFILTISQNFRSGTNVLIVRAINKIQTDYTSKELRISITVKTYPTYITVNGNKQLDELVLYDNGQEKELIVNVGIEGSYNTDFKIDTTLDTEKLLLRFTNGLEVSAGNVIKSGTKLILSVVDNLSLKDNNQSEIKTNFVIKAVGNDAITFAVNIRIVPNLIDATITVNDNVKYDSVSKEYSMSKLDTDGKNTETTFTVLSADNIYIPTFKVFVENENIVKLTKTTYLATEKSFTIYSKSSGQTDITLLFDNGLEKTITLNIYTPVNKISIDLDNESRSKAVGDIQTNKGYYDNDDVYKQADLYFALKLGYSAQLLVNPYDINNNLISDYCVIETTYTYYNNNENLSISNTNNVVSSIKATNEDVVVKACYKVYDLDGNVTEINKVLLISVYISVNSIDIKQGVSSVEYITLYTNESLGYEDKELSKTELILDIKPLNASKISNVSYKANFINAVIVGENGLDPKLIKKDGIYYLTIIAKSLGTEQTKSETGTITFSVQEFNIVYTKKVYIKIIEVEKPSTVLLENIEKLEENGNSVDYLYFNLGYSNEVNINPKVYPTNSYNLDYVSQIEESSENGDPIKFENGIVTPKKAGSCYLLIIPKACINAIDSYGNYSYDESSVRKIRIFVADGELIPYQIKTREDVLSLAPSQMFDIRKLTTEEKTEFIKNQNNKYAKKYVLTKDIDLSGITINPIGVYQAQSNSIDTYQIPFTGEFSGSFSIDGITNNFSISGISLSIDNSFSYYKNVAYIGLFAQNNGKISNVNLIYSSLSIQTTLYNPSSIINGNSNLTNIKRINGNATTYFGGIASINDSEINNCAVKIYDANFITYFGNNYLGGIAGLNNKTITNCSVSGYLNIVNGYKLKNIDKELSISVGGIVGENTDLVIGSYSKINSGIFNKSNIDSIINISSLNSNNEIIYNNNDTTCYGLIVGNNKGTIKNTTSYGKVFAYDNIGGIAGINEGSIENSLSASSLYGETKIGGLVGNNFGKLFKTSALILDDNDLFIIDSNKTAKIVGNNNVGGLVGLQSSGNISNSYIRSFVNNKEADYYDIYAINEDGNFGAMYYKDDSLFIDNTNNNFADNLKINRLAQITNGSIEGLGIVAPSSISINIKNSALTENSLTGYNKFIKANDNTIILFNYNNKDFNYILQNFVLEINYVYESGVQDSQKIAFNRIESNNSSILVVDEKGNFLVKSCGEIVVKVYSLLDKTKYAEINVKIINEIHSLQVYKNNNLELLDNNNLIIEKDKSSNLYLNNEVLQEDIYVKYDVLSDNVVLINSNDAEMYKTINAQVVKGIKNGNVRIKLDLYLKVNDIYCKLPYNYIFNAIVKDGLKNYYSDIEIATIFVNSYINANLTLETDLVSTTNLVITQELEESGVKGNYLTVTKEKQTESGKISYSLKIGTNQESDLINSIDENGKVILLKVFAVDDFVTFEEAQNNETYLKIIRITIKKSDLLNIDLDFFADGETVKNSEGQDIYSSNELASSYIKIGKIGILKINVYPIQNLTNEDRFILTYSNADKLNLAFNQVKKVENNYIDVNTDKIISNGIILDSSSLFNTDNTNEKYLYVKLLTDSPIKEDSVFNLNLTIDKKGNNLQYNKSLTSKLASNIEISFNNAILNSKGELEAVYAKGIKENQIVSVMVNKLSGDALCYDFGSAKDYASLILHKKTIISSESTRYDYLISGLNSNDTINNVTLYFYLNKLVNGKIEKYTSKTLKLNIVDFVITNAYLEGTTDNYLVKPIGADYKLKIKLNTINNGSLAVLNKISELEQKISEEQIFTYNNNKIEIKTYGDFAISKITNNYYITPIKTVKSFNFNYLFNIGYNSDNSYSVSNKKTKYSSYFENNVYTANFTNNFGINFYLQTDINNPVPIYTQQEFENMQAEANYILLNDISLINYAPNKAVFKSFDGNGYTITVKSLNINLTETKSEYNFGLFSETNEITTIKNLTVKYDFDYNENTIVENQNILNLKNISSLYFGGLVARNKGLIYNCFIEGIEVQNNTDVLYIQTTNRLNNNPTNAYIGGLVAENNGIITNSRSELKLCVNKGYVAGFVCDNKGTISSSYYKKALIKNLGEDENTSATAGFVYLNSGKIYYSFVEGEDLLLENQDAELKGRSLVNANLTSIASYCLTSPTNIGGFIYINRGKVEDSYSNASITSNSYSGGFVYSNSGYITRCYSACYNEKQENIAHAPFIATKIEINENSMKELLVNCFYLKDSKTSAVNDNLVNGLNFEQFNNEYYLTNFVLGENTIWKFVDSKLPVLIEANNIADSKRRLYSAKENNNGSIIYSYVYETDYMGSKSNPIIISNEEEFLNYFATSNSVNKYNYRMINNIDFSEYANLPTSNYIFSGNIDGNGLEISNMRISAESNFNKNSFGLFSEIKGDNGSTPVVKNLTLKPLEVYANNIQNVGTLAGKIENAKIINITVDAKGIIVQGRNVVGGIVGQVLGNSKLINIISNISANSNYSLFENGRYIYDSDNISVNDKISYSGLIAGIVDTTNMVESNENVRNIIVKAGNKSLGQISGLAYGLIGENSGVDNTKVYIDSDSYINASYAVGLVSGENRGYISRSEVLCEGIKNNLNLIKNSPRMVGGIVGFNNNGTVVNSIQRIELSANNALIAGGIAGVSAGGSYSSNIVLGNINSKNIAGGIIGYTTRKDILSALNFDKKIANTGDTIKNNNIIYISNCVVFCDIEAINRGGIIGAIHNTISQNTNGSHTTIKNSYITYNNYYKNSIEKEEYKKDDLDNYLDINGQITTNPEKYVLINTYYMQDFAVSNVSDFTSQKVNLEDNKHLNSCATSIESISINIFNNFSKNTFDFSDLSNIKLKENNNINTKKLEGNGSISNPYFVESIYSLIELSTKVKDGEIYINLFDNIEATGKEIRSIGNSEYSFEGTFNGNGYYINGLTYLNKDYNNSENYFGLFGFIGESGKVKELNIVANFVINYGANVNYSGIIAGYNKGYISKCNVYGGMICVLQNIQSNYAVSYIGGLVGINAGRKGYGIVDSTNNATIYATINDEENSNELKLSNITIYAGLIAGSCINGSSITRSYNYLIKNLDLNIGAKNYTLIVINSLNENCKNYVGEISGYCDGNSNVYQSINNTEIAYKKGENIYDDNSKIIKSVSNISTVYLGL